MVRKIFPLIIVYFFSLNVFAQNIKAHATVDKQNYIVGDYIYYTISVDYPKGLKVYPPFIKDSLKSVSLIQKDEPLSKEDKNTVTETYKYVLAGYDSAGITIPPIPILYKTESDTSMQYVLTNPVSFTVRTVKVNEAQGIKDVKDPIKIPLDWRVISLIILAVLLLGALAFYFYRRYQLKKKESTGRKVVIKLPPHAVALSSLNKLEEKKLWQQGLIKEYHSEITEIIRKYFEDRFNFPALELTTSEAAEFLRRTKDAVSIYEITINFLSNADMVKFAKFNPASSINEEMMKQAYEIVNKTVATEKAGVAEEAENVQ